MQGDANLVIYESATMTAVWSSGTYVRPGNGGDTAYAIMQGDGHFMVIRNNSAVFASGTWGHPDAYLVLEDSGLLVIHDPAGTAIWTGCDDARCYENSICVSLGHCPIYALSDPFSSRG